MPKEAVLVVVPQPHVDLVDGGGEVEAGTSTCTHHQAYLNARFGSSQCLEEKVRCEQVFHPIL